MMRRTSGGVPISGISAEMMAAVSMELVPLNPQTMLPATRSLRSCDVGSEGSTPVSANARYLLSTRAECHAMLDSALRTAKVARSASPEIPVMMQIMPSSAISTMLPKRDPSALLRRCSSVGSITVLSGLSVMCDTSRVK